MLLRVGQNNAFLVLNETETVSRNCMGPVFVSVCYFKKHRFTRHAPEPNFGVKVMLLINLGIKQADCCRKGLTFL